MLGLFKYPDTFLLLLNLFYRIKSKREKDFCLEHSCIMCRCHSYSFLWVRILLMLLHPVSKSCAYAGKSHLISLYILSLGYQKAGFLQKPAWLDSALVYQKTIKKRRVWTQKAELSTVTQRFLYDYWEVSLELNTRVHAGRSTEYFYLLICFLDYYIFTST